MSGTPDDCIHLTTADVQDIHTQVIEAFGGLNGVRDHGLLESAILAPQATAFGASPFADLIEVAAAYLFYLCRNHPFHDGNKRVALAASIVFLRLNGIEPSPDSTTWETLMLDVASSKLDRLQTTERLRALVPAPL
jgi:death on curing protein